MTVSRRELLRSGGLLGAGLLGAALSSGRAFASMAAEARYPHVTGMIDRYVSGGSVAGMVAALGWGEDVPVGIARGVESRGRIAPVTLDSLFRIYSMTKPVTGMAAMMLVDEGKLQLDQPIADVLPKFAKMQVQVTPDGALDQVRPAKTAITVRHLLTHTAGLGYTIVQTGPIKAAYEAQGLVPAQISRVPVPGLWTMNAAPSLEVFADRLAELPLVYEPGTRWSYSVGLDLLGRVIEVVSGQPFDVFLAERMFAPAGMDSTWFRVPESQVSRLTTNYALFGGRAVPLDPADSSVYLQAPAFPYGGAGLVSSPRDYDRFLAMLLGQGRIGRTRVMSEAAVRLGTSNLLPPGAVVTDRFVKGGGFGAGGRVGLGEDAGTFGWAGAAGTVGFINTRVGARAGLYVQFMPSEALPVQEEFPKAVLADVMAKKVAA
ncbi:beta-lactamase family protein [Novosphingobium sp. KCTC 2891]|uniref:serine hydrolase domain-containing protein n=1 Tax=Novosphingobium sp. KCTC 2891 TaxID=2989730 RepID=UPI0022220A13|nr:serine hydrolase domain-containing protein [Novosphingobium sp. KCTC 2891]MCW1382611.1 beta-lactamase family protein [Novosphingobium sp. KCTC 2891]